jgi:hypothetical protein
MRVTAPVDSPDHRDAADPREGFSVSPQAKRPPRRTPAELRERMPRRTPAETRDLMLAAAVDLLRERAQASGDEVLAAALAHVRLSQVAERATAMVREQTGDAAPGSTPGRIKPGRHSSTPTDCGCDYPSPSAT